MSTLFTAGFNGVSDDDTFDDAQRAINQLLHELQHLGRVWTVLPPSVYYKSMGGYPRTHASGVIVIAPDSAL